MDIVSVIVPVYNTAYYLKRCIDSILKQTFKDFELILVDDGSTDGSSQICDDYVRLDNRVVVIHKNNGGAASAKNSGLDYIFCHNRSSYLTFIDSDDYVDASYLQELFDAIKGYKLSSCFFCRFSTEVINKKESPMPEFDDVFTIDTHDYWKMNNDCFSNNILCGKMYIKKLFENVRIKQYKVGEDGYTLLHFIINECSSVRIVNKKLYFYMNNPNSLSNDFVYNSSIRGTIERLELLTDRTFYFYQNNYKDLFIKNYHRSLKNICILYCKFRNYIKPNFETIKYLRKKSGSLMPFDLREYLFFKIPFIYSFLWYRFHVIFAFKFEKIDQ